MTLDTPEQVAQTGKQMPNASASGDDDDAFKVFNQSRKDFVIPKDAPVLPSLASIGGVELVVKDDGSALVLYDTPPEEQVFWVEYDMDLDLLTFVTWTGKVFGLGLKIHAPFRKYLRQGNSLYMVWMKDGETPTEIDNVVMIVRRVGI